MSSQLQTDFDRLIYELERTGPYPQGQYDRRTSARMPYPCVRMAAPFDGVHPPTEENFREVRCHDLSVSGITFLASQRPATEHVIIHLNDPLRLPIAVNARVVYCREGSGDVGYPFIVGCKFVEKPSE